VSADRSFFPHVKDSFILVGWIAGILLIASLCWFLTQPVRERFLMDAVNRVLAAEEDGRRLSQPLLRAAGKGSARMGRWFALSGSNARVLVFTFIADGGSFPCAAVINSGGNVEELIPLSVHGKKMMSRVSPGVVRIYTRRIEGEKQ
jgi:hypothetical protein